ncbi:hypothetical protein [Polyangium aurulentum]|uniref:hypothetical protein n=1 Tax=Polyangium aurulentum TaxID=2567896 RepID=UPI0019801399|nr:hypothetical protein [Polyangium aurulentum]UQA56923.1 hypothetical protein E8A73_037360 [Polyangium aurulentum]
MASRKATVLGVVAVAASAALMAGCILDLESLTQGSAEGGGGSGGSGGSWGSGGSGGSGGGFGPCGGAGCSKPCEVTKGLDAHALLLDGGGRLYASSRQYNFIARIDLSTGTFDHFVKQTSAPEAMAITAGNLVWVDADGVWACPLVSDDCVVDRAPLHKVQGDKRVRGLAVDAQYAYFAEDDTAAPSGGRILRCPVAAGCALQPQEIATAQAHPSAVVLEGDTLFWTQRGEGPQFGRVSRAPKGGGMQVDMAANLVFPGSITRFADQVLWAEETDGDMWPGGVSRCLATSSHCTPTTVVTGIGQPQSARIDDPVGVVTDGKRIYFANNGSGTLMACEYPSCTARPKVLFDDVEAPQGTALGEACVYVTDRSHTGRIIAVPK